MLLIKCKLEGESAHKVLSCGNEERFGSSPFS